MGIERYQESALRAAVKDVLAAALIATIGLALATYAGLVYLGAISPPHWLTLI